ncbi:hypothetical protein QBC44DRAFT_369945 [Cladorrhinum sp. PSN332]|nr:hypothetical protein QBC44DRAFT_369945 [Cladorrhinum sp. PSN332]
MARNKRRSSVTDKILNAPEQHLRAAVRALCYDQTKARDRLEEFVDFLQDNCQDIDNDKNNNNNNNDNKNKPSDFHVCTQCGEFFFEVENEEGDCVYHPGKPEMNDDHSTWDDWEEWRDGRLDDPTIYFDELPEGFIYTCCNQQGDAEGCAESRYVSKDPPQAVSEQAVSSTADEASSTEVGDAKRRRESSLEIEDNTGLRESADEEEEEDGKLSLKQDVGLFRGKPKPIDERYETKEADETGEINETDDDESDERQL